jgi:hypothetical protein
MILKILNNKINYINGRGSLGSPLTGLAACGERYLSLYAL